MNENMTRELWLNQAANIIAQDKFAGLGHEVPKVHISVGFPKGGRSNTIGQCWAPTASADGSGHIFISPVLSDTIQILGVLVHEMVHAVNHSQGDSGHGKPFSSIAKPLGLEGKMTATVVGPALAEYLNTVVDRLGGPFPHAALSPVEKTGKSRSGKVIKLACVAGEDYVVSISKARLELWGPPTCPCHGETMEVA